MRLADIRPGMKLVAVGAYADCINEGDRFVAYEAHGALNIACRGGGGASPGRCHHELKTTADESGDIPELEIEH